MFTCRKPGGANWDVDAVLPLVNSELGIRNFIGDSIFSTDQTGLLSLRFNRQVAAIMLDSLIKLPNTKIDTVYSSQFTGTFQPGSAFPITASDIDFTLDNGVKLKRVDVRSGQLTIKFSNTVEQPLDFIYQLREVTKNGQFFTIVETIPPGTGGVVKTYDLTGYSFNLRGPNGSEENMLVQSCTVAVSTSAQPVVIQAGQGIRLEMSYADITPAFVEGYFGQQTVVIDPDTTVFSFIKNLKASNFLLNDVKMDFTIKNEIGADFRGSLSNIKAINNTSGVITTLTGNQLQNLTINRATRSWMTVTPSEKKISFNKTNSNIPQFISTLPEQLAYQGSVLLNPEKNVSGGFDFAFYNTGIRIFADVDIPLRFNADYFELNSEAQIDLSSLELLDKVNHGNFVVTVKNGYPFDGVLQAYMLDRNKVVIDSLFVPGSNTAYHGNLDVQNEVTSPFVSKILIPIAKEKVANLRRARSMKMVSRFVMPPNPPDIRLLERYSLEMNVVAEVNYRAGVSAN
jgi:hypothetical protein